MITAGLVTRHYEERLAEERHLGSPASGLMQAATETWGDRFARQHVRYAFDNHQGNTTFPLPSHMLAFTILGELTKDTAEHPDESATQVAQRGAMANQYVMPLIASAPDPRVLKGAARVGSYCIEAEPMFAGALAQARDEQTHEEDDYARHGRLSVYHAADGTPIAFRKQRTDSSALLLEPVQIDDVVTAPAGTIVDIVGTTELTGQAQARSGLSQETYAIGGETRVSPLRIGPWVYDEPVDRALFGITETGYQTYVDLDRARQVANIALDDFREAAAAIMARCGTT